MHCHRSLARVALDVGADNHTQTPYAGPYFRHTSELSSGGHAINLDIF